MNLSRQTTLSETQIQPKKRKPHPASLWNLRSYSDPNFRKAHQYRGGAVLGHRPTGRIKHRDPKTGRIVSKLHASLLRMKNARRNSYEKILHGEL